MVNKFAKALKNKPLISEAPQANRRVTAHERPIRRGKKHVGGYFSPEVSKQLRQIALNEDTSVQHLLGEALNMIFHSREMPAIAEE